MLKEAYHIAVPTAFKNDEELDIESTLNHITRLADQGVRSVLVCGSTGEQHSLTLEEKLLLVEALDAFPLTYEMEVLFGVSSVRQRDAVRLAEAIKKTSISGIMLGFPPYIRPSQEEVVVYVGEVVKAVQKPTILYNHPLRTGFDLGVDTMITLFNTTESILGLKEAGTKTKHELASIKSNCQGIKMYAGGEIDLQFKLEQGFNRLSSIAGNVAPTDIYKWFIRLLNNETDEEKDHEVQQIVQSFYEQGSPIVSIKTYLHKQGLGAGVCRSPLGQSK
ncbi:dihydrodipicolinate synthase family protein [Alkalihalobacillus sp. NPDC078783]